jgi:adenosylcobinamide-phosphate guanylyltransferase
MLALIMAGGEGSRLGMGEKPLVTILGMPMISRVIEAFRGAGLDVVVVATPKTCFTQNWCRAQGIPLFRAAGLGYVEDLIEAVSELDEEAPLFTCGGDMPCITPSAISAIRSAYWDSDYPACSVWIPLATSENLGLSPAYTQLVNGVTASPAGVNILLGERITEPQPELQLLMEDPALAFNINTGNDLECAVRFLQRMQ